MVFAAGLSGCSFTIPLHLPPVPAGPGYTARHAPTVLAPASPGRPAQRIRYGEIAQARWWTLLRSAPLDRLVARALRDSPTIAAAQAQLREAQANMAINASVFYPQVTGGLSVSRNKTSGASFGGRFPGITYSLFSGDVAVSYYPDFFGVNRLVYQGSRAQMLYQRDERDAAQLTLAGNVVDSAVGAASTGAQIRATQASIRDERALLMLTQAQYASGAVSYNIIVSQRSQLLAVEAELAPLRQQFAVYRHQLAILTGSFPGQWRTRPLTMAGLHEPDVIPVALPSTLVRHRPDIRAATEQMHYAIAQIGVARAQFFPTVTLSAMLGTSALRASRFFDPISGVWGIAADLVQPIFEGGKLRAQKRAAYAAFDTTFALYRSVVLDAFAQVADALRALQHDGRAVALDRGALAAAQTAYALAQAGYRAGSADYLSVLTADIAVQNARIALARAEGQRLQDTVALFVALGGDDWGSKRPVAGASPVAARSQGPS
ncbi:MAG: efflux transporter outer membrane subunit [Gammaproteobacteria bacterium]|nr:efflux transporter outer membrane subunit [Gammaproteobacteria bacterium]